MLAVAPVPAGAVLVMPLPARVADHALYCAAKLESTAVMTRISPGGLLLASGLPVACGFGPHVRCVRQRLRGACGGGALRNARPH
jgi:hypothetical protein